MAVFLSKEDGMLFSRCQRSLMRVAGAALALSVAASSVAMAKPKPGKGFRLLSSAVVIFQTNRVQCRIFSDGSMCATGSSTVGGGIWPRGTADQYVFGSGINIAGVIEAGDKAVNGFAGDTAGAFFNNTGGSNSGVEVRPIFSSADAADLAAWPDEARVPCSIGNTDPASPCLTSALGSDPAGDLFAAPLQGAVAASQGDLWFMSWEGDPAQIGSRTHPMGVAVETRVLGWNFPNGNEDIMYVMYTFYNITTTDPAAYAAIRPSLRTVLLQKAADFQALNSAKYGINLPAGGYAINDMFVAHTSDMDVAQADVNFASVNVPFALGYTYDHAFSSAADLGWTFDPSIFGTAPFFSGVGFVGVKFLRTPVDPTTNLEVGLSLFGTFSRSSGSLQDPNDDKQLYRYITGGLTEQDGACSLPNPQQSRICFVNISSQADMRMFLSSGPLDLAPGGSGTVVFAYIFAAPVRSAGCPGAACSVKPASVNGNLTIMGDAARMASGVNKIDTMTGYLSFNDSDGDGNVIQSEINAVPGSLLGKSNVAQTVFTNKFLLPFSPERPDFFLVPGDNQVTILWNRSATETTPDPFFNIASQPQVVDPITGGLVSNALYDPNFRPLDVEGYRIYRGRVDNPTQLQLIAQFDYAPDATGRGLFPDFRATVNPVPGCAPELGIQTTCPITFSTPLPGEPFVGSVNVDLVGVITQIIPGNRVLLESQVAQVLPGKQDTAFADINAGRVAQGVTTNLVNGGVPFLFVDHGVRNSLRYFYAVSAFDVNSAASGPSSLESQRKTKSVTPSPLSPNQLGEVSVSITTGGRNGPLTNATVPTIDPATGKFSGPFPPADGGSAGLVSSISQILGGAGHTRGAARQHLAGHVGQHRYLRCVAHAPAGTILDDVGARYGDRRELLRAGDAHLRRSRGRLIAERHDRGGLVQRRGRSRSVGREQVRSRRGRVQALGQGQSHLAGDHVPHRPGYWLHRRRRPGFDPNGNCVYNGARWFDGPSPTTNETKTDPNAGNSAGGASTDFNNAGELTGVTIINEPHAYIFGDRTWRNMEWTTGSRPGPRTSTSTGALAASSTRSSTSPTTSRSRSGRGSGVGSAF